MSDHGESMQWVDETVATSLRDSWGHEWPKLLKTELDSSWTAGWEDSSDDLKNEWLVEHLAQSRPPEPQSYEEQVSTSGEDVDENTGTAIEESQLPPATELPSDEEIVAGITQAIITELNAVADLDREAVAVGHTEFANALIEGLREATEAALAASTESD